MRCLPTDHNSQRHDGVVAAGEFLRDHGYLDRPGDPDDGDVVGYQGIYSATAVVTKAGDPAKAQLTDSARETLEGDRLFSMSSNTPLDFVPRAPKDDIEGRIISVIDGVQLVGQYQIVVINRGSRHGLEVGNILAIDQAGEVVRDRYAGGRVRPGNTTYASRVIVLKDGMVSSDSTQVPADAREEVERNAATQVPA